MNSKGILNILLSLTILLFSKVYCNAVSVIQNNTKNLILTESPYFLYEDSTGLTTIENLLSKPTLFKKCTKILPENDNRNSVYWVKFPIIDSSNINVNWFLELYNYRIDSLDIYVVYKGEIIQKKHSGDHHKFGEKEIPHKNFVYILPQIKNDTIYYYLKVKSQLQVDFYTVIKSVDFFVRYSNGEYYLLGALYGILGIMFLYNLFHFLIVREKTYLFYLFSIIGFMVYFMSKDGTGFQYLWSDYPQFNDRIPCVMIYFAIINQLLFAYTLFKKVIVKLKLVYVLITIIVVRTLYFLIILLYFPTSDQIMLAELPALIFILIIGLKSVKNKEFGTFYFPIGTFVFLVGFTITAIFELNILPHSTFVVYASAFALVGQIILYGAYLSFRHNIIILNKKIAEQMLVMQKKEIIQYEKYQKELIEAVNDATQTLVIKNLKIKRINEDLEIFIYKLYHNIRGPIRSIMGICNISETENNQNGYKELFSHVNVSINELDKELLYFAKITSIQTHEINLETVNLYKVFKKYFKENNGLIYSNIEIDYSIQGDKWLLEESLSYVRNIFDKLIKSENTLPEIEISKLNDDIKLSLTFETKPIEKKYIDTFFEPYNIDLGYLYNLYTEPYISRLLIDKINGQISISLIEKDLINITIQFR